MTHRCDRVSAAVTLSLTNLLKFAHLQVNQLKIADSVVKNFDLCVINADTAISKTSSPTREVEIRVKKICVRCRETKR